MFHIHGIFREFVDSKYFSEFAAHQISTLTGVIFIGVYIWLIIRSGEIKSSKQAFSIGATWLCLNILFELVFGYYVMNKPLENLLHDYNLLAGRVWIFFLLWITIAPYLFYKLSN